MTKFIEQWRQFTPPDKLKIVLSILALCVSAVAVTYLVSKPGGPFWNTFHKESYYEITTTIYTSKIKVQKSCIVYSEEDITEEQTEVCK